MINGYTRKCHVAILDKSTIVTISDHNLFKFWDINTSRCIKTYKIAEEFHKEAIKRIKSAIK